MMLAAVLLTAIAHLFTPELLGEVESLRGLTFQEVPTLRMQSAEEFEQLIAARFEKAFPPERTAFWQAFLARFGVLKKGDDFKTMLLNTYGQQALAYYDAQTKSLVVVEGADRSAGTMLEQLFGPELPLNIPEEQLQKMVLAHELVHALQDQRFRLRNILPERVAFSSDETLARQALVEGDATFVQTAYLLRFLLGLDAADLPATLAAAPATTFALGGADLLTSLVAFPYTYGMTFVAHWIGRDPAAYRRLYAQLPRTTEVILHPDKYMKEGPLPLPFGDDLLEQAFERDTLGEYLMSLILTPHAGEKAAEAAQGWGNDRLFALKLSPLQFFWATVWDEEEDAVEFQAAYEASLRRIHPDLPAPLPSAYLPAKKLFLRRQGAWVCAGEGIEEALAKKLSRCPPRR